MTGQPISESFKDLITSMISAEPNERLDFAKIQDHEWLVNGPVATDTEVTNALLHRQSQMGTK